LADWLNESLAQLALRMDGWMDDLDLNWMEKGTLDSGPDRGKTRNGVKSSWLHVEKTKQKK
jgi:hypothetical protein